MSISQEWTKAIRDVRGVFLAIRTSLGSARADRVAKISKTRAARVATTRSTIIADRRFLAELELRKNLVLLNNSRSLVK